ncbi:MAG TPA: OmpA family protein [Kofleriaceae bacterium]|jgi:peptidoglycan-associated lipoprotein|nr:OmpA family protein [Kofleriaceae bacterium]
MRLLMCTILFAGLAACSSKPKYPICGGDKDCRDGEHCVNKKCLADQKPPDKDGKKNGDDDKLKSCKVDEDCADDEDCIDGKCRKPWKDGDGGGGQASCTLESIYFGYDQFTVSPEGGELLTKGAECLKTESDRGIYVVGHTDPRGTEEYNIALSERRARAVADYLSRLGIDPARMHVVPKGESEAQGSDEASFEKDRRVDFEWR